MDEEKINSSVGGRSMVALLMPNIDTISDSDSNYALTRLWYIYEQVPDLEFIYYGGGVITRFQAFVRNVKDLFSLQIGSNVATQSGAVVVHIKESKSY